MAPQAAQTAIRDGLSLPAGAIHDVDYLVANTTRLSAPYAAQIATATDRGSVGGSMVTPTTPAQRYCPTAATVNGLQYADFSDVPGDAFRDYLLHDGADPTDFPIGGATDDDYTVGVLFELTSDLRRYAITNMATITANGSGFYIRHESDGSVDVGMTTTGQNTFLGVSSSSVLADGWHFVSCKWGNGTYAHYVDDMATAFASGSYTWSGTGGNPTSALAHGGRGADGVTGLGGVAIYARALDEAERNAMKSVLMSRLGL